MDHDYCTYEDEEKKGKKPTKSHAEVCKAYYIRNKPELLQKAVVRSQKNRDNATPEQVEKEKIRSQQRRDAKKEARRLAAPNDGRNAYKSSAAESKALQR
jgi:hypothetical protein